MMIGPRILRPWYRLLEAIGIRRRIVLGPAHANSPRSILGRAVIREIEACPDGVPRPFKLTPDTVGECCAPLADEKTILRSDSPQPTLDPAGMWIVLHQELEREGIIEATWHVCDSAQNDRKLSAMLVSDDCIEVSFKDLGHRKSRMPGQKGVREDFLTS